jgi:hypothetical protein
LLNFGSAADCHGRRKGGFFWVFSPLPADASKKFITISVYNYLRRLAGCRSWYLFVFGNMELMLSELSG